MFGVLSHIKYRGAKVSKFLTYVLLFAANFVLTQTSAKAGDRSFDSQIKEVGHRKYQRSSTLGKVTFYFSDQAKCKLDDNLQKRTLGTINAVDTLFTSEQIYEAVEIDEWCDPTWSKNNAIILGQESGGPVLSDSVIAHEYAHSILGKNLGYQAHVLIKAERLHKLTLANINVYSSRVIQTSDIVDRP